MPDNPMNPNADRASEDAAVYGEQAKAAIENVEWLTASHPPLAPDGLPWPAGYFDKKPRVTLEEAIRSNGVRPSRYRNGFPIYTIDEFKNPNFTPLPDESEWVAELLAAAEKRELEMNNGPKAS
jgi:hypothetical protein